MRGRKEEPETDQTSERDKSNLPFDKDQPVSSVSDATQHGEIGMLQPTGQGNSTARISHIVTCHRSTGPSPNDAFCWRVAAFTLWQL